MRLTPVVERSSGTEPSAPEASISNGESFEVFFVEHQARLFGTLCLVVGDPEEAEELMQEAFTRVWERWDKVSSHADPDGYLYMTAFNVFRDRKRRLRVAARHLLPGGSQIDAFSRVDEEQTVLDALRKLTP